jgi:hypothetical protein
MSNFHFDPSLKLSQGEVHDFSGEVQNDLKGGAKRSQGSCAPTHTSPQNPAMDCILQKNKVSLIVRFNDNSSFISLGIVAAVVVTDVVAAVVKRSEAEVVNDVEKDRVLAPDPSPTHSPIKKRKHRMWK